MEFEELTAAENIFVHPTAVVEPGVLLGRDVKIWHFCHVRSGAQIGQGVTLGKSVFVDAQVQIGQYSKIQNGISIYSGVSVGDFCFIGPHSILTNDLTPRSYVKNWKKIPTFLRTGASIGAGSVIKCGIVLGEFSLVGAGSIVTKDVLPFHLYYGFPAKIKKKICACGKTQYPLNTPKQKLINSCCEQNLMPLMYRVAQEIIDVIDLSTLKKDHETPEKNYPQN